VYYGQAADNSRGQIWFQNRRQIQRRKQRPLLPHEITAFGLGNLAAFSSDSATGSVSSSSQSLEEDVGSSHEGGMHNLREREVLKSDGLPTPSEPKQIREGAEDAEVEPFKESASTSLRPSTASPRQEAASHISGLEGRSFAAQTVFKSFSSAPGYLANRWNAVRGSSSTSAQTTQSVIPT
jgi:hypothetical protein